MIKEKVSDFQKKTVELWFFIVWIGIACVLGSVITQYYYLIVLDSCTDALQEVIDIANVCLFIIDK